VSSRQQAPDDRSRTLQGHAAKERQSQKKTEMYTVASNLMNIFISAEVFIKCAQAGVMMGLVF